MRRFSLAILAGVFSLVYASASNGQVHNEPNGRIRQAIFCTESSGGLVNHGVIDEVVIGYIRVTDRNVVINRG